MRAKLDDSTFARGTRAARDAGRRRPPVRPRGGARGQADARLLRERGEQLRHPAPPGRLPRGLDPARSRARSVAGGVPREIPVDLRQVLGLHLQDPGQHGPAGTATGSPSCGSARASSSGTWRSCTAQTGKTVRLSSSHKLFGQDRETVDEAWPGDVIGLVGHDAFGIGDTLTEDRVDPLRRDPALPARRSSPTSPTRTPPTRRSSGRAWSSCSRRASSSRSPPASAPPGATLLAAVGPLQFEVVQYRLKSEYGAESRLEVAPWTLLRWIEPHPALREPVGPRRRHRGQLRRGQARPAGRALPQRLDHALLRREEPGPEAARAAARAGRPRMSHGARAKPCCHDAPAPIPCWRCHSNLRILGGRPRRCRPPQRPALRRRLLQGRDRRRTRRPGAVLFEDNADAISPPASMTKLMTFAVLDDEIKKGTLALDTPVTVTREDARVGGVQGQHGGVAAPGRGRSRSRS